MQCDKVKLSLPNRLIFKTTWQARDYREKSVTNQIILITFCLNVGDATWFTLNSSSKLKSYAIIKSFVCIAMRVSWHIVILTKALIVILRR